MRVALQEMGVPASLRVAFTNGLPTSFSAAPRKKVSPADADKFLDALKLFPSLELPSDFFLHTRYEALARRFLERLQAGDKEILRLATGPQTRGEGGLLEQILRTWTPDARTRFPDALGLVILKRALGGDTLAQNFIRARFRQDRRFPFRFIGCDFPSPDHDFAMEMVETGTLDPEQVSSIYLEYIATQRKWPFRPGAGTPIGLNIERLAVALGMETRRGSYSRELNVSRSAFQDALMHLFETPDGAVGMLKATNLDRTPTEIARLVAKTLLRASLQSDSEDVADNGREGLRYLYARDNSLVEEVFEEARTNATSDGRRQRLKRLQRQIMKD